MDTEAVVDTAWLKDRLDADGMRVIDVRSPQLYRQGHIPGAVSLPLFLLINPSGNTPDPRQLAMRLGRSGIGRESHVVAYDDGESPAAAQLFWMMTYLGHPGVSVLDGGAAKWTHEGLPWACDGAESIPTDYRFSQLESSTLADLNDVRAALESADSVILDVRSEAEYRGLQRTASRDGHIPGAVHVDWQDNLLVDDDGVTRMRPDDQIRALYGSMGVTPDKHVVIHCHVGVRACETFLMLKKLGYPHVSNYAAGWQEWGNRPDTPVETA